MKKFMGEENLQPEQKIEPEPKSAEKPESNIEPQPEEVKEKELSPEVIEMIMEKVQDINAKGTAFNSLGLGFEKFEQILEEGLLGKGTGATAKRKWARQTRKEKQAPLWFNIVGRSAYNLSDSFRGNVAIVFDLSGFKEEPPIDPATAWYEEQKYNNRTYRVYNSKDADYWKKHYGDLSPESVDLSQDPRYGTRGTQNTPDYGFVLFHRVAPRLFRGIAMDERKDKHSPQDQLQLEQLSKKISATMRQVYRRDKENMLLPIYDVEGNLWWPRQMSYEEVKKFVEERDKDKKEK